MPFAFDPAKSLYNKDKHGIDFSEAQAIWSDPRCLIAPARNMSEPRFLAVGKIGGKIWAAVFTVRDGKVRIISVRRARDQEIDRYEDDER